MNWHHGQNQCIPRVPADPEKEWKMTGINLLSGNGEGSEVDKKFQERMGEETTFLQFIGSCVTLGLYNPSGQQKQCSKSSLFNVQCWQSWVGEGGTQVVRGLGTVAGYGMEAGGSAIRTGLWLARGTGDLALVSSTLIGARGSLNHTTTEWRQLRDAMAEITQLESFVEKMENIKTGLDAAIEKATTEYMCAIFKKYILPDIQQMKINLTSITKVVDGKAVQEIPEAGSAEANNLNRQIILELAKICDIDVMEELADKLQFDQKLDESRKPKQAGPVPVGLIINTAGAAPGVAPPPQYKMTDLDWFRLFLPHYTTRYMDEFQKASGTGEEAAKKSKEDILKEAISHNIASGKSRMIDSNTMTNLQTKYGKLREMIGLYDEPDPKKKGQYTAELASFQSILKHYEELSKISVADAGTDWALLEKGFAFVGSSLKQRQEAAAAAELNRQQKAQEATNMAAAIARAREPLERELREAKARTEQVARNATAAQALAVERAKGEATKNALARERTAANAISRAAQAAANALARAKAPSAPAPVALSLAPAPSAPAPSAPAPSAPAPSAPAPAPLALAPAPSANGSRGGQLRNREAEGGRRLPRGRTQKHKKTTARKARVSRKYKA
jgi:hypothetical protein